MKRKKKIVSLGVLTATILLSGLGLGGMIAGGSNGGTALAAAFEDPLALLGWRSPGARKPGALFQTKIRPSQRALPQPSERVLAGARERPAPMGDGEESPNFLPMGEGGPVSEPVTFVPPGEPPLAGAPPSPGPGPGFTSSSSGGSSSGGSSTGGSSSGGTSSGGGSSSGGDSSGGSSGGGVVPEPSTWLMLMLGMFALGGAMRHRFRVRAHTSENSAC